jgi:NAD(P)-dependent dehydrogenase (short-subunit alcohol dehydrogenase family)
METVHCDDAHSALSLLAGRVAIVTGAGRGIGRCHALELARRGAHVIVNDLGSSVHGVGSDTTPAKQVAAEIESLGGRAVPDHSSVTDWDAMRELVSKAVEVFGRLDIVVNNAGVVRDRMITGCNEDDFDAVVGVHLRGTFNLTKHASDHWRALAKRGDCSEGRIINTTSGAGLFGNVGQSLYGAAKAGIAGLTIITAMEMGRYNVTANAISPMALTRIMSTIPSMRDARLAEDSFDPLDPANSSPLVAYLASPASGWLTGQVLRVEGNRLRRLTGWTMDDRSYTARAAGRLEAGEIENALRSLYGTMPVGIDTTQDVVVPSK